MRFFQGISGRVSTGLVESLETNRRPAVSLHPLLQEIENVLKGNNDHLSIFCHLFSFTGGVTGELQAVSE